MDTVKLWKKVYANFTNCEIHNKLIFRNQLYSIRYAAAVERLAANNLQRAEAAEARAEQLAAQLATAQAETHELRGGLINTTYQRDEAFKELHELRAQLATAQAALEQVTKERDEARKQLDEANDAFDHIYLGPVNQ